MTAPRIITEDHLEAANSREEERQLLNKFRMAKAGMTDRACESMRTRMKAENCREDEIEREVALLRIALTRGTTIGVYE